MNVNQQNMLQALEKAVHSGNITAVVPEDLEIEAHNTLWNETSRHELTLMKLLPSVNATSITHEYTRITSYGFSRNTGFFGERSLPPETNFGSSRIETAIKRKRPSAPGGRRTSSGSPCGSTASARRTGTCSSPTPGVPAWGPAGSGSRASRSSSRKAPTARRGPPPMART